MIRLLCDAKHRSRVLETTFRSSLIRWYDSFDTATNRRCPHCESKLPTSRAAPVARSRRGCRATSHAYYGLDATRPPGGRLLQRHEFESQESPPRNNITNTAPSMRRYCRLTHARVNWVAKYRLTCPLRRRAVELQHLPPESRHIGQYSSLICASVQKIGQDVVLKAPLRLIAPRDRRLAPAMTRTRSPRCTRAVTDGAAIRTGARSKSKAGGPLGDLSRQLM